MVITKLYILLHSDGRVLIRQRKPSSTDHLHGWSELKSDSELGMRNAMALKRAAEFCAQGVDYGEFD